jgi:hypothetical protein
VPCHTQVDEYHPQSAKDEVVSTLLTTIDSLSRSVSVWEDRAKRAVEYGRYLNITGQEDLRMQLAEALARNKDLEERLKLSQLSAKNLDLDLRSAHQRAADQERTIVILQEQYTAAVAKSVSLSEIVDKFKLEKEETHASLNVSRREITKLEAEVNALKQSLREAEGKPSDPVLLSPSYEEMKSLAELSTRLASALSENTALNEDIDSLEAELDEADEVAKEQQTMLEDVSFFLRIVDWFSGQRHMPFATVVRNIRTCFNSRSTGLYDFFWDLTHRFPVEYDDVHWAVDEISSETTDEFRNR